MPITQTYRGSLNSYLVWIEYLEPEVFQEIQRVISSLFPTRKAIRIDRRRLMAVVDTVDGTAHDIDLLISGEQNLLLIQIELRRRLMPGSIVLIDEIENSLHIAFQHRIGRALKRLRDEVPFQLVVTSHSKTFVDIFGAESTLILPTRSVRDRTDSAVAA